MDILYTAFLEIGKNLPKTDNISNLCEHIIIKNINIVYPREMITHGYLRLYGRLPQFFQFLSVHSAQLLYIKKISFALNIPF